MSERTDFGSYTQTFRTIALIYDVGMVLLVSTQPWYRRWWRWLRDAHYRRSWWVVRRGLRS